MIQHAIGVMFGITALTPIKAAWVAITVANVLLMFWLSYRTMFTDGQLSLYMWMSAIFVTIQGSPIWSIGFEVMWAAFTARWIWFLLPKHTYGRIFALSIGLVVTCVLMLAVPPPWAGYDPVMYETRLYSTAAFLGVALGSALMTRNPSTMLAVSWFGAVMLASAQRGWNRWWVGICANLIWTACLILWLAIVRASQATSSTPDAPDDYQRSSQYLP